MLVRVICPQARIFFGLSAFGDQANSTLYIPIASTNRMRQVLFNPTSSLDFNLPFFKILKRYV